MTSSIVSVLQDRRRGAGARGSQQKPARWNSNGEGATHLFMPVRLWWRTQMSVVVSTMSPVIWTAHPIVASHCGAH